MSNVYIKEVEGGENTNPDGTEAIEIDNGTDSEWVKINNLFDGAPSQGDVLYFNGTKWKRLTAGTDGQVLTTGGVGANPAWEDAAGGGGGGEGILVNGVISVSVASNDLTVAIKTLAGADPSAGDPVSIQIGGVVREITSALSVTKNDGTNWCNAGSSELATKLIQYFVYIGYNATDGATIGFSRIPYARAYSDFSTTTTNEKYCAISVITNAASTDKYVNIGRFSATLSAGAGYTWSISGTGDVVNYPIFVTDILSWQPSYSATGSMTYTSVTTSVAEYRVVGRKFELELITLGTTGGTAAPGIRATMPFGARNYTNTVPGSGWTADGSGTIASCIFIDGSTANLLTCRRYDGANYGLGTNRYIAFNGGFSI